jgi:hypothetical protein
MLWSSSFAVLVEPAAAGKLQERLAENWRLRSAPPLSFLSERLGARFKDDKAAAPPVAFSFVKQWLAGAATPETDASFCFLNSSFYGSPGQITTTPTVAPQPSASPAS